MLLKAKCREMDAVAEYLGLGQDAHTANAVKLHLHVRIAVGVSEIRQMGPISRILGITLDNNGILIEGIGKRQGCVGLLPRIQIVGLFSA
jgi:hypothetical protein